MAKESSQKFIARNRAPRVQIEYDVELYGAEKVIQLPFVMGVLADLSGKPAAPLPAVDALNELLCDDGLAGGDMSEPRTRLLAHPGVIRADMRLVHRHVTD